MSIDSPEPPASLHDRLLSPPQRMMAAAALGACVFALSPSDWRLSARLLAGWDAGGLLYIALAAMVMRNGTPEAMRRRAMLYDEPRISFVILTMLAIVISYVAIFLEFSAAKTAPGGPLIPLALGAFTLFVSWALTHTMFTLHYAHLQYGSGPAARGIQRPEKGELNYTDLFYFSFLIGCATEGSDFVSTNSAMRRFMIVHSIVAYFFNVVIIAMTISVISSLI